VFTILTAGAFNYVSLLVARFLFGAGEAGAFPCVARVLSRWVPLRERGTAKGIFFAGAYASAAATTFVVTALLPLMSWRTILVVFGCVGFVWIFAWHRWFRDEPGDHPAVNQAECEIIVKDRPPELPRHTGWHYWRTLMRQRNVLLLCALYMPNCATFYFCITWLPSYLRERHGFENTQLGLVAALPLFLSIGTQFFGGYLSDRITVRYGITAGRRTPGIVGYSLAAVFILSAVLATDAVLAAVFIALAASACMLTTAPAWSTCVDIGREHSATVSATMNTSGQIAAILVPPITGYSLKLFNNWDTPFWLLTGLYIMGAVCWAFIEPKKPVFAP
jgi:MFS family permease